MSLPQVDITKPRFDQSTYINRAKHFILVTNPLNVLATNAELDKAARIVNDYKHGKPVPDVTSVDQLWKAKYLYESAFHPDTGEKMTLIGRMSAQVPMNMTITGCMMTFYKSTPAVLFWQWVNQSFNAIVNYTNKSGGSTISNETLFYSYCAATGGAIVTALTLNKVFKNMHPLIGRLSPMISVWSANCINIPLMRFEELKTGIVVRDSNGNEIGPSKKAAQQGIAAVVFSRICMATPGMLFTPILMNALEKRNVLKKFPWANAPVQTLFCGFCLTFATPLCCALFSQIASIKVSDLEDDLKEKIKRADIKDDVVYYNKGL